MKNPFLRGLVILAVGLVGCSRESSSGPDGLARLEIFPAELVLLEDDEFRLEVRGLDAKGRELGEPPAVEWSSEDPGVASVSEEGVVKAVSVGRATVSARSGSLQAKTIVQVHRPGAFRLEIVGAPPMLHMGAVAHLNAHLYSPKGEWMDAGEVHWSVSDPSVVEIRDREIGVDLVPRAPGKATVRAAAGRLQAEVEVLVPPPAARLELAGPRRISVDETAVVVAQAYDAEDRPLPLDGILPTWGVGPFDVLEFADMWLDFDRISVRGVAPGAARVTASWGTLTASIDIRVGSPVASIEISPAEVEVAVGDFVFFSYEILDTDGNPVYAAPVWTFEPEDALRPAELDVALHPASPDDMLVGYGHFVVQREGTIRVRAELEGKSAEAVIHAVGAGPFVTFQIGGRSFCGLTVDGEVVCYGEVLREDGSWESVGLWPTRVASPEPLAALSVGPRHICGLSQEGRAYCMGKNLDGALGTGDREDRTTFTPVATDLRFREIHAGADHTCAISTAEEGDNAYCWGDGTGGKLGTGEWESLVPTPIVGHRFATIAVSRNHTHAATTTCGIDEAGSLFCWGGNDTGQLGNGTTESSLVPMPIESSETFSAVAVVSQGRQHPGGFHQSGHVCALTTGMEVRCWGDNSAGQITLPGVEMSAVPVAIEGGPWTGVSVGLNQWDGLSCAIDVEGTAHCWGSDTVGWAFGGTQENFFEPTPVGMGIPFRSLDLSPDRICGIDPAGKVLCWGSLPAPETGSGTRLYLYPICLRGQICH